MGIKECCVRHENEIERNLQKVKNESEDENATNIENGAVITDKTSYNKIYETNTNIFNNKYFFIEEEDLLKEKNIIKIQKRFRIFNNKNKFKKEIKPKISRRLEKILSI